jgi:para-nitrobenzyl esterase
LDVPFTFGTLDAPGMAALAGEGDVPRRISDQMIEAWLAFAREGRPCAASLGDWPAYDPGRRSTMILGEHPGMVKAPREEERSALAEVVAELVP